MYLNCHSYHSLRYGTIPVKPLVKWGEISKVTALALTDINTVTGIYEFVKECRAAKIKPIVGIEFRQDNKLLYIGLAKQREGIGEMNRLLTKHNFDAIPLPDIAPDFENVFVIYPLENVPDALKEHEYIGIRPEQVFLLIRPEWKNRVHKMVILQPVTYRKYFSTNETKKRYKEFYLHKILRAIDRNVILTKLKPEDHCQKTEVFIPAGQLLKAFEEYPEIISNTNQILRDCNFEFLINKKKRLDHKRNKAFFTGSAREDGIKLAKLAYQGLSEKYGNNIAAKKRLKKELDVIYKLNFSAHYLIVWDIIQYSNSQGFMHIGRGSGANSIVSYCLGITDICPMELDLYFERFLNLNRTMPPDFDIDWSWADRDEILRYVFEKYDGHVAFCGTIAKFKYRSIFRELGKVFGLPKEELDILAKNPMQAHDKNNVVKLVHEYGMMLEKYPNQRSMHACGIFISEEPITNFTALEMPPKGFPLAQIDMNIAELVGLEKFDILSQRGIGHINDAAKLIKKNRGIDVDIRNTALSKDEAKANEFLSRGQTIGCFYIESPAMRGLLRRLKCDNYKVLVAASSIIRPGVAQSGMMKEYIFRHNYPDRFEYFHNVFKEQLGETYGIMVYQEDVIKIAEHFGGLEPRDGDILRRGMTGKTRSKEEIVELRNKYFRSCAERGHSEALSQEVYRQIESFAGFSFCKAHSASYAVESYQSLYLKVYYPVEFMVAVINNQGGFYRTEVYVHEARMSGGVIHVPCVNKSEYKTTLYGINVYLGFMHLQNIESRIALLIPEEREKNGDYVSLEDFVNRIPIGIENIQTLIFIGAFRFTGKTKNELLVIARLLLVNFKPENSDMLLLKEPIKEFKMPLLERSVFEDAFDEIELLSFPVSCSPFDLLQTKYRGNIMAKNLTKCHKKEVKMLAYLISRKHVPTKKGDMFFGTWIDVEGEYFDTAHFTDCLQQYPFQGGGCYLLLGTVEVDYHFPTVTIHKMAKMPFIPDPRYENAKDRQYDTQRQIREDVSMTHRAPYPQEHEIGLPRYKMK